MANNEVITPFPIPNECDVCCSPNVVFTCNGIIYGKNFGDWPYIYFCEDCRASVGCHAQTNIPLGRMADRKTKKLRRRAHDAFDPLWQRGLMTRDKAYKWLALQLGIDDIEECHMSRMTKEQLVKTAELAKKYIEENAKALIKRQRKQNDKAIKRNERTARIERYKRASR